MKNTALICLLLAVAAAASPINSQGPYSSPTNGVIDPTVSTWNSSLPLQCTASTTPTAGYIDQNRAALQLALTTASSTGKLVIIPPCSVDSLSPFSVCPADDTCGYPIGRNGAQIYSLDFNNLSHVTVFAYGAVIRLAGNLGHSDLRAVYVRNTSHVKFMGVTWSQRDVTNFSEQTHTIHIGSGSANPLVVDDVEIFQNRFIEGKPGGGDCVDINGSRTETVSRINIIDNTFDHCGRGAVNFSRGSNDVNIAGNRFLATHDQDIDNEITSTPAALRETVAFNFMDRNGSTSPLSTTASGKGTAQTTQMWFAENQLLDGYGPAASLDMKQIWIRGNMMSTIRASDPLVSLFRRVQDVWVVDNDLRRKTGSSNNWVMSVTQDYANCGGGGRDCLPRDIQVRGNRLQQYAGASPAIEFDSVRDAWVSENKATYHNATNDTSVGFVGVKMEATATPALTFSGWIVDNQSRRDFLDDGVTQAGRPISCFSIIQNSGPTVLAGHFTVRDNYCDGTNAVIRSNLTTALEAEGIPVVAGNFAVNFAAFVTDGITGWRTESTQDAEVVSSSGALSASTRTTLIGGDGIYTLPACHADGLIKHVKVTVAALGGTLTPSGFGDGTSVSWLTSTAAFDLACDVSGGKWWLLNASGISVTL